MRKLWRVIKLVAYSLCIISTAPRHIIFTGDEEMWEAKGKGRKEEPIPAIQMIIDGLRGMGADGLCKPLGCKPTCGGCRGGLEPSGSEHGLFDECDDGPYWDCVSGFKGLPPRKFKCDYNVWYYPTKAEAEASKKGEL